MTEKHKARRFKRLTASRVAGAMNLSPYETQMDTYLHYVEGIEHEETYAMRLGTMLEPFLIRWCEDQLGVETRANQWRVCKAEPWLGATLDAVVLGKPEHVQAKMVSHPGEEWGEEGTDQVPPHVILQVQAEMVCAATTVAWIPAWVGYRGPQLYRVAFDRELVWDCIVPTCREFWRCVLEKTPPTGSTASLEILKRVKREPGKTVEGLDDQILEWVAARDWRLNAEKKEKVAEEALLTRMGDAEAAVCEHGTVTYMPVKRTALDQAALKKELPEIAEKYMRTSSSPRINWKPNKER